MGLTLQGATKLNLAVAKLAEDNLVDGNLSTGNLAGGNITLLASDVCNLFCAMLQYLTDKGRLELLKTMKVIKSMSSSISFTVRPRDTRPQDAPTLTMHVFE